MEKVFGRLSIGKSNIHRLEMLQLEEEDSLPCVLAVAQRMQQTTKH